MLRKRFSLAVLPTWEVFLPMIKVARFCANAAMFQVHQPPLSCSRCVFSGALCVLLGKTLCVAAYPGLKMCWAGQMHIRNNFRCVLPLHALHAREDSHGASLVLTVEHRFKAVGLAVAGLGYDEPFCKIMDMLVRLVHGFGRLQSCRTNLSRNDNRIRPRIFHTFPEHEKLEI